MHKPRAWDRLVATWFGLGLSPKAPGTVGSLGAIPLEIALWQRGWLLQTAVIVLLTLEGTRAANAVARALELEDPQLVVVDEVVGALIAMGMVAHHGWPWAALAWGLFRLFDITKPGPVDWVQRLKPPGVGIMADDVLAGLLAGSVALGAAILLGR